MCLGQKRKKADTLPSGTVDQLRTNIQWSEARAVEYLRVKENLARHLSAANRFTFTSTPLGVFLTHAHTFQPYLMPLVCSLLSSR